VGRETNVDLVGLQMTANVLNDDISGHFTIQTCQCSEIRSSDLDFTYLTAEAVADSGNLLHTESLTDVLNSRLHNGAHCTRLVLGQPGGEVDLARVHVGNANLVTLEKIRDHGEVAIVGELVSEELGVVEDTEDIGQEDNGLLGVLIVLGVDNIGID
jgi:hypothetical protein